MPPRQVPEEFQCMAPSRVEFERRHLPVWVERSEMVSKDSTRGTQATERDWVSLRIPKSF